ncbi:hypothetical protein C7I85_12775 [Mesorhizobium soli]|uniref:Uncharacterized protein n=1 Tax=Pseudaminobacter soli (ex Li et al. 2025) TaxID=1295366 RepID=A0A2P7SEJ6_9HYPH|nr:hypothetical protein C7I85_12775 [Mesorhizobium soli]
MVLFLHPYEARLEGDDGISMADGFSAVRVQSASRRQGGVPSLRRPLRRVPILMARCSSAQNGCGTQSVPRAALDISVSLAGDPSGKLLIRLTPGRISHVDKRDA